MKPAALLASVDGEIVPSSEAVIPATDDGLLRGDGVFEVLRLYSGLPFALDDHLARMERSAANLRLAVDLVSMRSEAQALLAASGPADGLLRLVATRGGRRLALIEPLPDHSATARLGHVTYAPTRVLDAIKSLSYAANMLSTRLARERGFDEALLVTPHGRVLEAPTSSFFWARDGVLRTPPLDDHILASVTRERLTRLVDVVEEPLSSDGLGDVEEAFLASTTREVQPVSAIEEHELVAPGPLTAAAVELLRDHVRAELETDVAK